MMTINTGHNIASTMARKFIVGGNWKMNGNTASIGEIVKFLTAGNLDPNTEVVVGVPAIYLKDVRAQLPCSIGVAAQNCYKVPSGAFTGKCTFVYVLFIFCKCIPYIACTTSVYRLFAMSLRWFDLS